MTTDHQTTSKLSVPADRSALADRMTAHLIFTDAVFAISHSNYRSALGGTEKVLVEEQAALRERQISYVQIFSDHTDDRFPVQQAGDQPVGINVDSHPVDTISLMQFTLVIQTMISRGTVRPLAVHLHHLLHFSLAGLAFLIGTLRRVPVRFFVHDYFSICSSFNLLNEANQFCGHQADAGCGTCQRCPDPVAHREGMQSFFDRIRPEVVVPSDIAGDIWARYFPHLADRVRTVPHQLVETPTAGDEYGKPSNAAQAKKIRIAYVGYEQVNKGLETWWRLCDHGDIRHAYDLYHLGTAGRRLAGVTYVPVSFQDEGPDAMVNALIRHGIDVVLLWSIWPETYSFTFFESLAAGCYVITNRNSGNIQAQVRQRDCGQVFDSESEMLRFLSGGQGIKSALANGHSPKGKRFVLRFNPELSESVEKIRARPSVSMPPVPIDAQWMDHWYMMAAAQMASDRRNAEEIKRRAGEIDRLRAQLAVYQISRLHRLIERFRQWWQRHPNLSKYVRPVFVGCSQPFIYFFRR
ncbi:MAG: hypothetical protein CR984_05285 [Proteobacteria bacterium]|nr:MAG: hypothetical protein CR984_05285 [Pseudomonadota bacterium]PIE67714.1 MAG: hypothetical protein CSA23_02755 [Deltaproteobacteria bacterium]